MLNYAPERLLTVAPSVAGLDATPHGPRSPAVWLDTRERPLREQYASWIEQVAPIVETKPDLNPARGFAAELQAWALGELVLVRARLPPLAYFRSERQCRSDGLDHWVLTAARGRKSSSLGVLCLGQPFAGYSSVTETAHLCVPRDFLRRAAIPMDSLNGTIVETPLGRLLADFLLNLADRMPELEPGDYPGVLSSVRAMIEGCIAPARRGRAAETSPMEATLLERARRLVQQRLGSPTLGVEEICRELGVSRSRLYRLFEPLGGVVHYIRHRRLLDAHMALADSEDRRPIVDIAAERGFIDPAEFSRAFKREFGYRPSDARANREPVSVWQRVGEARGETLADLLIGLR